MPLRTLGELALEGSEFRRLKPLMLVAYLSLEGPKSRRYLAELFWPGASDAMNSLSVALSQLRKGAPQSVEADEERAWSNVDSDASELQRRFAEGDLVAVVDLYSGAFLEALDLEFGEELEEWIFSTRETLAETVREALLRQAEAKAGRGEFNEAGELAERALQLAGSRPPESEALVRFHTLLAAGRSAGTGQVRNEAAALGISLRLSPEEARAKLRQVLVGRERQVERLSGLAPGEWAWLRGETGMGKTALLKHLSGTYLPSRAGLPYATLEPLLGGTLGQNETSLLKGLSGISGTWLFDDWELMDQESRLLLTRLRSLRPLAKVIVASKESPPFDVEVELELSTISCEALGELPDAWEQTGGLPELVGAYLRDEPLEPLLERRLGRLSADSRDVYLSLALLNEAEPAVVRHALELDQTATGNALDELLAAGLIEASGVVRARRSAHHYLERRPKLLGTLALRLARQLDGPAAFPLYQVARPLWDEHDLKAIAKAYLTWAEELLRRGFALQAADVLTEAPRSLETTMLRARALERSGRFKEALDVIATLAEQEDATVSSLKSALLWRLGRPEEAQEAAERGLNGGAEARAEALNTLGVLARSRGEHQAAVSYARRAAALWNVLGNKGRWVDTLNNLAIAETLAGVCSAGTFGSALEAAGDNRMLTARTLLNSGWAHEYRGSTELAEKAYRDAADLAEEGGAASTAAWALNNLGVLHHKRGQREKARRAYEEALALAQRAGEQRILGVVMANLGELTENLEAWEEALHLLEQSGHHALASDYREELPESHPFRVGAALQLRHR